MTDNIETMRVNIMNYSSIKERKEMLKRRRGSKILQSINDEDIFKPMFLIRERLRRTTEKILAARDEEEARKVDLTDLYKVVSSLYHLEAFSSEERKLLIAEIKSLLKAADEKNHHLIYEKKYRARGFERDETIKKINLRNILSDILVKLIYLETY